MKIEKLNQKINETKIADNKWYIKHKNSLQTNYGKATKFKECKDFIFNINDSSCKNYKDYLDKYIIYYARVDDDIYFLYYCLLNKSIQNLNGVNGV